MNGENGSHDIFSNSLFYKIIIFKCFPGFFNPTFSFIAVTKLNVLDRIFFLRKIQPTLLERGRHWSAHQPIAPDNCLHSADALPSGFSTKLPR
jgi:hypothetical protein